MKKGLLLSAVLLAASTTYASKARLSALQYADHLTDTQTVFTNTSTLTQLNPYLTVEMGTPGTNAEGGLLKALSNGDKILLYAGHKDESTAARVTKGYLGQQNPFDVLYATGDKAFGAAFSTIDNKKSKTKETTVILRYGQSFGASSMYAHLAALSTASKDNAGHEDKLTSSPGLTLGGAHNSGDIRYFGKISYVQSKEELVASDVKTKSMGINLGIEDRSLKNTNSDIYYGAVVKYSQDDVEGKKITKTSLPVFVGIEHTLTSWATFRGSVSQNLIVGSEKDETATNKDAEGIASNTLASAGLGLKYDKLQFDGALTAAADGNVNGNAFLTQAAVTYNF